MSNEENKISLVTLGCAKNLVDTEMLVGGLKNNSYEIVEKPLESDVVIVNTCGFLSQVVCGYFGMRREVVFANCECRLPEIMLFQN